ncbi:Procollagen galactosyltransferase 2 [Bagarius yarrelli]|uniref:Procollagen galactosyltransferase 2 n=1 Tax=Bagarius yarrelli TaxID=175774 RepID=A0A556V321_BAGYA|nr:Procollagen galactosyltransferase 2 [Bagarius yarrelli]
MTESAPFSEGFCNSPSSSAVSALQSKVREISQRQSKAKGPPESLQKESEKEPMFLSIPEVKIFQSSSGADEVSKVQNFTTSIYLKENKWKKEGDSISSLHCDPGGSKMQNLSTSGESSTVLSMPTSFTTVEKASKGFWNVAHSKTFVSNKDFDSLQKTMKNVVNTREEKQKVEVRGTVVQTELQGSGNLKNRCFQKEQNPPNQPEKEVISEKKKVQTNKLTSSMLAEGLCQPPLINKGLPLPHKEAGMDKTIIGSEINFGSNLTLSPRHEQAKRLLERARLKTRFQNQNSDTDIQDTPTDFLELLPMCNPPSPQIITIHKQKVPLSVHLLDVQSKQSQLLSHVNFEYKSKKEAEHHYQDKVGYQRLGLMDSSLSKRQSKAQSALKVSQDSKGLESSYGSVCIPITNQRDPFLLNELTKDEPKKCETCGSILPPSYLKKTRQNAEWASSGQSSHQFIKPKFSEGTSLTGSLNVDRNVGTTRSSNAGKRVSAFGKLRRRSRKGENRVEASHRPYARGQDLLAQRRNSRTKSNLEEVAGPHSKPVRGVTFALDSFIPTATNSSKSYRDASGIQLPIKSALKSGSKSRPVEQHEVKNLPLYKDMEKSYHYASANPQDLGAAFQVSQVSLEVVAECRPIVQGAAVLKTEDLRAKPLRLEHCKDELQWDASLGASRRTLDREGCPKLSLRRIFSAMGLNSIGKIGKDNRSSSMEHLPLSSNKESPLAQLRKASSVQSLQSPKKKHERSTVLGELHLPLILGPRYPYLRQGMENLDAAQLLGPTGRIVQTFPDGSLLLELTRPVNTPFGFVISRRKGRPDSGIFVEQVVGSTTENIYTSLLGVGDEILEVNGEKVNGLSLDQSSIDCHILFDSVRNHSNPVLAMQLLQISLLLWIGFFTLYLSDAFSDLEPIRTESSLLKPKVMIAVLARNSEHSLPFYLGCLERLDYPKDRIAIWVAADHSMDNTTAMLQEWLSRVEELYHSVRFQTSENNKSFYDNELGPKHWPDSRFIHVMQLRQAALQSARAQWADYILFADSDNLLTNPKVLSHLIAENHTLVAPMLESRTLYSNFWCGMTPQGYYKRTDSYIPIRNWKRNGCHAVPMIHSTMLLDLRRQASHALAFYPLHQLYPFILDDILAFSFSARQAGVQMFVCNRQHYGYLPVPLQTQQTLEEEMESFSHTLTEAMLDFTMEPSHHLHTVSRKKDRMVFDEIYIINLMRRTDRRARMLRTLDVLGIEVTVINAVDGKALNSSQLQDLGIEMLPSYQDPYSGRVLTKGEIGCFLSHYNIWKQVVERNQRQVLVLEDDVRFEPNFKRRLNTIMEDVQQMEIQWDLIYVGRKRLQVKNPERWVKGVKNLVYPDYSYWTLGYTLSLQGAKKLLEAKPLGKMLPVDEFLPLMFNKHPKKEYLMHFKKRNLIAFSVEPFLLYPTHYTGEPGYSSDTETSTIWDDESVNTDWDRKRAHKKQNRGDAAPLPTSDKDEL